MRQDVGRSTGVSDLVYPGGSRRQRAAASIVGAFLFALALVPLAIGGQNGPVLREHEAIGAAWWIFAELGTAFLLLSTFYASGNLAFAIFGGIYATVGLLEIPYVLYLPGHIVEHALSPAEQQISPTLWAARTLVFGMLVTTAIFIDPSARLRVTSQARASRTIFAVCGAAVTIATLLTLAIVGFDHVLPVFSQNGQLTLVFSRFVAPALSFALALAVVLLVGGLRRASPLQLWLVVVLGANVLSVALLATHPAEFSITWYASWLETICGSSIVLIVMVVDVAEALRRLAESARFDALTGLTNRRAFEEHVVWAIADCEQRGTGIALLVIDIDFFKLYNDRYGHAAGDEAMRQVARVLQAELRGPSDIVSRIGGEEFVALLVDASGEGAYMAGERLRRAVERLDIPADGSAMRRLTVSVGAASGQARNLDRVGLFKAADGALYNAKSAGRNQTVLAKNVPSRRVAYLRGRERTGTDAIG